MGKKSISVFSLPRSSACPAAFPASASPPADRLSPRAMRKKFFRMFRLSACCYPSSTVRQACSASFQEAQETAPAQSRAFETAPLPDHGLYRKQGASISKRDRGSIRIVGVCQTSRAPLSPRSAGRGSVAEQGSACIDRYAATCDHFTCKSKTKSWILPQSARSQDHARPSSALR